MEKYVYSVNEIRIAKTQCDLCIFRYEDFESSCKKYAHKSKEIIEGMSKCPYLKTSNLLDD